MQRVILMPTDQLFNQPLQCYKDSEANQESPITLGDYISINAAKEWIIASQGVVLYGNIENPVFQQLIDYAIKINCPVIRRSLNGTVENNKDTSRN